MTRFPNVGPRDYLGIGVPWNLGTLETGKQMENKQAPKVRQHQPGP